jgi:hypothetical protein
VGKYWDRVLNIGKGVLQLLHIILQGGGETYAV